MLRASIVIERSGLIGSRDSVFNEHAAVI